MDGLGLLVATTGCVALVVIAPLDGLVLFAMVVLVSVLVAPEPSDWIVYCFLRDAVRTLRAGGVRVRGGAPAAERRKQ